MSTAKHRANEGDLAIAAEHATAGVVNFMITFGRGLVCTPITSARAWGLGLPPIRPENGALRETRFTRSVDAADGIIRGISTHDRAHTIRLLLDKATQPSDLSSPRHILPLIARDNGVLTRPGHTQAAVDLARLVGLKPAPVLCEILNPDGTMARPPDLERFGRESHLAIVPIADHIAYRNRADAPSK